MVNRLDFVNRFYSNRSLTPTSEPEPKSDSNQDNP